MVFATICFNYERRNDLFHLLNDLRNLDYEVYVMTNLELNLDLFQFENVNMINPKENFYHDFQRFNLMLKIFQQSKTNLIYYLDCDSRFFNFRKEKFNKNKFEKLLKNKSFEILTANFNQPLKYFFGKPKDNEDKNVRLFNYGYDTLIEYMNKSHPNFTNFMDELDAWEGHLIFKKTQKIINFLNEMIKIGDILVKEDIANNRKQIACTSASLIQLLSKTMDINLKSDPITHHFFKANFLKEIFPYNQKVDINEKIFTDNNFIRI